MTIIDSSKISIIIQGPINGVNEYSSLKGVTYDCLEAVRKIFPKGEIILSTWKGSNVKDLNFDQLILNKDPGAHKFSSDSKLNNINRLIVSTKSGVNKATREYCLKIRSDIIMLSDDFLKYFDKFPARNENYRLFEHKIIACSNNTVRYFNLDNKYMFTPFHVSDWVYFGLTKDIKLLFNIDQAVEPKLSNYFIKNKRLAKKTDFFMDCNWQFPPEQYIIINAFKQKFPDLILKNKTDYNYKNIRQSDQLIMNNFIVFEPKLWKFVLFKKEYYLRTKFPIVLEAILWRGIYKYTFYKKMYKKIFNKKILIVPQFYEIVRDLYNVILLIKQNITNKIYKRK